MKTVTKEDLCGYLPYELKIKWFRRDDNTFQTSLLTISDYPFFSKQLFKPIMHPLSSLTKPVLEGGKTPIEVLLDIESGSNWSNSDYLITENGVGEWWTRIKNSNTVFGYNKDNGFYMMVNFNFKYVHNQLQLFQKLYQWHFWLGDQSFFDDGIIIDKSSLK